MQGCKLDEWGGLGMKIVLIFFFFGGVVFLFTNFYPIPIFSHVNMCALSSPKPHVYKTTYLQRGQNTPQ